MLDKDIAAALGASVDLPPLTRELVPSLRAGMAAAGSALAGPELPVVRDFDADGVPVRFYRPAASEAVPLLVFLHGGGWMLGDLDTHDAMHREIAARAGVAVLGVGYRLAPEHPFPAGLEDALTVFRWARRTADDLGYLPGRVALGGESAGANLTAAVTLVLRDAHEEQPLFQLLIHPVSDMAFDLPSISVVKTCGLTRAYLQACSTLYLGDTDADDPRVSPLRAESHAGLARAIVVTAEEDRLRDDGEYYTRKLIASGVETLAQRLPGLPHGFMFLPSRIPAVNAAFDKIARFVRRGFADE